MSITQAVWRDACGVCGLYSAPNGRLDAAHLVYQGLFALQHRGQDSVGLTVCRDGCLQSLRQSGLVLAAIDDARLDDWPGHAAIGHVRSSSAGSEGVEQAQPMQIKYRGGQVALAMNGSLNNRRELRRRLQADGAIFQTYSDAELLLALLARHHEAGRTIREAVALTAAELSGAYAVVLLTPEGLIGLRDPLGIRPICLGRLGQDYILASESCAVTALGGTVVRDLLPGEIIAVSADGLQTNQAGLVSLPVSRLCLFEQVFFARPDSILDGMFVQQARYQAGCRLAEEQPAAADRVIGVPDSGIAAALGYARAGGLVYEQGIMRNHYVGRSFLQPGQKQREWSVNMKFSILQPFVRQQDLVLVDDSLIRGATIRRLVGLLRQAGAGKIHLRIASPPVRYPCFYGIDTPAQSELAACRMDTPALCRWIGADSLAYLSLDGLRQAAGLSDGGCASCFDGTYPAGLPAGQEVTDV